MVRAARLAALSLVLVVGAPGCGAAPGDADAGGASDVGEGTATDTSTDTTSRCRADADCADGLFCNGDERCAGGTCAAGTPPACADAIACTRDFCAESSRACVHQVPDLDMDGHGDASCLDATGLALGDDCADDDVNRFPGNTEVCDRAMHDEDCATATHGRIDGDSDGFEDRACCNGTDCGTDCDDSNRSVNTAASEVCNHVDDDCDGHVDEMLGVMMYPDADRDGYGNSMMPQVTQCGDTVGFAVMGGDCDDANVARNPGQLEVCDALDNDCDMRVDESAGALPWYVDQDRDGYGDARGATLVQCAPPAGSYSLVGTDCDDTTSARSPRAPEICNGGDDDCNGLADFAITPGDLEDDDHDGVADVDCGGARGMDCNDRDATALPGAAEICNGRDDDCDTHVDEDATSATFHRDGDGDGFGDPGTAVIACFAPAGYVTDARDCDDGAAARHPGASETCNASDDDCDHAVDEDPAASSCAAIPGAILTCTVGICHAAACQPGFSDCTIAAGCETSTIADDLRCGGCSAACDPMAEQCAQSRCVPGGLDGVVGVSPRDDVGTSVAANANFVVLGGSFSGTGFGVGCGTHLDAQGASGIVSVRDAQSHCRAALAIDGAGDEMVTAVAIDPLGNVFVALTTTSATLSVGSIAVNAGAGQGGRDAVIVGLDASLVPVWAHRFGGPSDDAISGMALSSPDLWVVGGMRGPAAIGSMPLPASATTDPVVIHLVATGTGAGSVSHVASVPTSGMDGALSVALDASTVYVVGALAGSGMFGAAMLSASGPTDGFLWLLSAADASTLFARTIGGSGNDAATGVAINTDMLGAEIGVTGWFEGSMTVDGVPLSSTGMTDGFVAGLDGTTRAAQWVVPFGGTAKDVLADITYAAGTFAVVGTYAGTAALTGGGGSGGSLTSTGGTDGVLFAVNPSGYATAPATLGGTGRDDLFRIGGAIGGIAYVAGDYDTSFMAPSEATFPSLGGLDAFWLQIVVPGA